MSYTKTIYRKQILEPVAQIVEKSLSENDFTSILDKINITIELVEKISIKDSEIGLIWNEIASDIISSIYSATAGLYRQSILSLRSALELACSSLFYIDHKIEYHMFVKNNSKADKYVSTLVNDYSFFTTKYIATFNEEIEIKQISNDSVSIFLKSLYGELSDIVHGRYNTLTKTKGLNINYNKQHFKIYEKFLNKVLSIVCMMYILRFKDTSNESLYELAKFSRTVNI
ncbi:hypothetical protein ACFSGI_12190 [Paenibacillus nicotianae]|uniref:Apea-like HEPN domain-containing protein n=1 Tax=Paenibacillus nicotianae TaxID=1526551 RepID=A0ABW4UT66_9BACL